MVCAVSRSINLPFQCRPAEAWSTYEWIFLKWNLFFMCEDCVTLSLICPVCLYESSEVFTRVFLLTRKVVEVALVHTECKMHRIILCMCRHKVTEEDITVDMTESKGNIDSLLV